MEAMTERPLPPAEPAGDAEHVPFSLERLVFFSDAVYAIAITLLAIDIRVPEVESLDVGAAILELVPGLFSYALSFAAIGLYWLAHWRRFDLIERTDQRLAVLNLAHLAFIALIPFPTSLLGRHGDQAPSVVLYALVLAGAGILGAASWAYAGRAGLVREGVSPGLVRLGIVRGLVAPAVFLASIPLVLVDPRLAELSWLLLFPAQAIASRRRARARANPKRDGPSAACRAKMAAGVDSGGSPFVHRVSAGRRPATRTDGDPTCPATC
jgi:uncharacterized membrane protein